MATVLLAPRRLSTQMTANGYSENNLALRYFTLVSDPIELVAFVDDIGINTEGGNTASRLLTCSGKYI